MKNNSYLIADSLSIFALRVSCLISSSTASRNFFNWASFSWQTDQLPLQLYKLINAVKSSQVALNEECDKRTIVQ